MVQIGNTLEYYNNLIFD